MRILHVLHSADQTYGGPITCVLDLSARALKHDLDSEVLAFGSCRLHDSSFARERVHVLPTQFPKRYCYSPTLRPWLTRNVRAYDGVVLHGMWLYPNSIVAQTCIAADVPYACFLHGMLEPWAVYGQGLMKAAKKIAFWHIRERSVIKNARCVFLTTERERQLVEDTFHIGGRQLLLAPYGIDAAGDRVLLPRRPDLLQSAGRKLAVFLGRLHPKKNVDLLITAWKKANVPKNWHLVIAGSGDERYTNLLNRMITENALNEQIHLVGFVDGKDKAYLLQRASWFLLPSRQENFGIAVVEATAYGCAVAISDQVFIKEYLNADAEVLPLHIDAWTSFIGSRMTDDAWQRRCSKQTFSQLYEVLNIEKVVHEWTGTFKRIFAN